MTSNQNSDVQLFQKQERIYPKKVSGRFRRLKWVAMVIALAIYYLAPFIRWDRGANAPDQAILIDMEKGRAYWFWFEIWPQEVYILTGILVCAAILLFFVTSLFGRVWCGYFCFQTVWTDLFIWVERQVQGDRNKRKRLREGPWTFEKIRKLAITHFLWLLIAWFTAGSFVLYFNDAPTLVAKFLHFDVSPTVLGFIGGLTFMTYLMAGFAREQGCTFMCPYARFQSAMFDKDTLIIGYDQNRGEPRGKHKKGDSWDGRGHCIDCTACVQVCPMGIDIRDGLQMECIACGLCIDACDDIMEKLDLPKGLIRYDTESRMEHSELLSKEKADAKTSSADQAKTCSDGACKGACAPTQDNFDLGVHLLRPRTFLYAFVLTVVIGLMLWALITRATLDLTVLHDRNPLFVKMSNGDIRNGYRLKIQNRSHETQRYELSLEGLDDAQVILNTAGHEGSQELMAAADGVVEYRVFVVSDIKPQEPIEITFVLKDTISGVVDRYETMFVSKRSR